jgi:3-oxoacyl-[acyl-carrier protein] reductase
VDLGLKDKNVLITGGSRGIGRAAAELFASEGANLGICSRNQEQVDEALASLSAKGVMAVGGAVDITDKEAYVKWVTDCATKLGGVDIFIHNASASGGMDGEQNWYANFELDLMGAVRGSEAVKPYLDESDSPSVIFISSTAATETFLVPQSYNALKAAIITYGQQLTQFWADKKIRVNIVSPGPTYFDGGNWDWIKEEMKDLYDMVHSQIPWGRLGTPEDIANAIVFLSSPAASYITGVNLVVDGGYTKRIQF